MDLTGDAEVHSDVAPPTVATVRIVGRREVRDGTGAFEYSVLPHRQWLHQDDGALDQSARRQWDQRQLRGPQNGDSSPSPVPEKDKEKPLVILGRDPPASLVNGEATGPDLGLSMEALKQADVLRRKAAS